MISFLLLLTAVCSQDIHKSHSHHHHDHEPAVFKPVDSLSYKPLKGKGDLPEMVMLNFEYEDNKFVLNMTQSAVADPEFFDNTFRIHYRVNPKHSFVNELPIDHGAIMFVNGKLSELFEGSVSFDGVSYSFKPSSRQPDFEGSALVVGTDRRFMESRRRLDTIQEFTDCWPGHGTMTKEVEIGYIVDPDFVTVALADRAGDDCGGLTEAECIKQKVTAAVTKINDETNTIYRAQFGVILKQMPLIDQGGIFDEQMTAEFPLGCATWNKQQDNIEQYLQTLAAWRTALKRQTYGVWKILTNCFPPPGTIGIAYLGTLCREYGVGITTWTGDRTWLTNAHEVGHIFGAEHSFEEGQGRTGGIMDYGDGTLNGVYQFNRQYRKNDVCGTISNTMAAPRVPNCWKTLSFDATTRYQWEKQTDQNGGTLGECQPARGNNRYRTTQYFCQQDGTTVVADELCDLGNKPIFNFATHQFSSSDCPAINTQVCGDGNLEPGEECEPSLVSDASCCVNCQWVNSNACRPKQNNVDAAFVKDNKLYLFQGDLVYKYENGADLFDAGTAMTGYPRSIVQAFPGLQNAATYANDLSAALVIPGSNIAYFFKGLNYVTYDLETNAIQQASSVSAQVAPEFRACGTVDAAVAFPAEMYLFCGPLLNLVPYGNNYLSHNVGHDLELNFPDLVMTTMDAAAHNPLTGETIFYNGGHETRWRARSSIGAAKLMSGLGDGVNWAPSSCPNLCATCDQNNPNICNECDSGYVLSSLGQCIQDNVFAILDFNTQSQSDASHVAGGSATLNNLFQSGKFVSGLATSSPLDDEQALFFDGTDALAMNPLNVHWDDKLRISAYFKPVDTEFDTQKFLSLTDGNEEKLGISFGVKQPCAPPTGCYCIESGDIAAQCQFFPDIQEAYCVVNADCPTAFQNNGLDIAQCAGLTCSNYLPNTVQASEFELQVTLPEVSFNCFVEVPLQANQWNLLLFEFSDESFTTGVNGLTHRQAFEMSQTDVSNSFEIKEWTIGAETNGIQGSLDHFQLAIGDASNLLFDSSSGDDSGNGGAVAAGVLIPLFIIALIVLAYFYRDEISEWVNDDSKPMSKPGKVAMTAYNPEPQQTWAPPKQPEQSPNLGASQPRGRLSFDISRKKIQEWYYADDSGVSVGPISIGELKAEFGNKVHADTYVWNPDMPDWIPAEEYPHFSEAFQHSETADVEWNYVGDGNENVGPILEKDLLKLTLSGNTYVWNGTTVNEWTFMRDTYLWKLKNLRE